MNKKKYCLEFTYSRHSEPAPHGAGVEPASVASQTQCHSERAKRVEGSSIGSSWSQRKILRLAPLGLAQNDRLFGRLAVALLTTLFVCTAASAQTDTLILTLDRAVALGQERSVASDENMHALRSAYVQYRNYRAELLPSVSLTATMPNYNKSLSAYQNSDGSYSYISSHNIAEGLGMSLSQVVPWTGGNLSVSSSLDRNDQLSGSKKRSYMSVPFSVTYSQPLFGFNSAKWARRIEPLRYESSRAAYAEAMEQLNLSTVAYYFNFLNSEVDLEIASRKRDNAHQLYRVAQAKKTLGTISDVDLMQLQVGVLNADASLRQAQQAHQASMNALKSYLGIAPETILVPVTPSEKSLDGIKTEEIRAKAFENNPFFRNVELRLRNVEAALAQARAGLFPGVNLYVSAGMTGSNSRFRQSYDNLSNRQVVQVGLSVPILDWGKRRNSRKLAQSQYDLERRRIERDERDFAEDIRQHVQVIADLPEQVKIYSEASVIAEKRYNIAFEKFSLGTISILDLNNAQQEAETARRNFINQLRMSWEYYYNIRYVTLFDFEKGANIQYELEF